MFISSPATLEFMQDYSGPVLSLSVSADVVVTGVS